MTNFRSLYERLQPYYGADEARAIVRWVLEERFSLSLTDVLCGKVNELSADDAAELEKIMQRLERMEPVQYVLGTSDFCGRRFRVAPGALIPRPETQELCAWVKDVAAAQKDIPRRLLDVGTGSGCIAITLALDLSDAQVSACDISEKALSIARDNATRLQAQVDFFQTDILRAAENPDEIDQNYGFIVSNPPYICEKERESMARNVFDYEPSEALFVPDNDPLRFYRAIAQVAEQALVEGGYLFFEINPNYVEEMKIMLKNAHFIDILVRNDCFGKQRMMCARRRKNGVGQTLIK